MRKEGATEEQEAKETETESETEGRGRLGRKRIQQQYLFLFSLSTRINQCYSVPPLPSSGDGNEHSLYTFPFLVSLVKEREIPKREVEWNKCRRRDFAFPYIVRFCASTIPLLLLFLHYAAPNLDESD